ncbi:MAG: hypothetical protein ACTSXZ_10105, partial [Alphaproteobacteria bacterium]
GSIAVAEPDKKSRKKKKKRKGEVEPPSPYEWQTFGTAIEQPVAGGVLGSLDLQALSAMTGGSRAWELRLIVRDEGGDQRESRMAMALPQTSLPQPAESAPEVGRD